MEENNKPILENEKKEKEKEKEKNNENDNNELISQNIIQTEKETEKKDNIKNNLENILQNNENLIENTKEETNKKIEDNNSIEKNNQEKEKDINKENNEKEKLNENISLKKEENKIINQKEDNIKPIQKRKGYVRTLRNLIKKKHIVAKNIIQKSFKLWKEETLKRLIIRRTIIIRLSISKEKDQKQRFHTEGDLMESIDNKNKNSKTLINFGNDDNNNSTGSIYKSKYNLNNDNHKFNNTSELMIPKEKKDYRKLIPNLKYNYDKEIIRPIDINNIIQNNRLITFPNREFKPLYNSRSNLNIKMNINDNQKKYLDYPLNKINNYRKINEYKNYNNVSRHDIVYKSNNEKNGKKPFNDIIDTKYKNLIYTNNNKPKYLNNNINGYLSHRNVYLPYQTQTYRSNYKRIEKPEINNFKLDNIKKYTPLTKNNPSTLLNYNYSFFRNVYPNNNTKYSTNTYKLQPYKGIIDRSNYNSFTFRREMKLNKPQQEYDMQTLKKGVTTVVQHYSGIKEKLNNTEVNTLKIRL